MIQAIQQGILLGLSLSILLGPVFFALLEKAIREKKSASYSFAVGILCSDSLLILFTYFGLTSFIDFENNKPLLVLSGAVMFLIFGLYYLIRKVDDIKNRVDVSSKKSHFFQGFFINLFNPSVLIFWSATVIYSKSKFNDSTSVVAYYVSGLVVVFVTDLIKINLSSLLKHIVNHKVMYWLNKFVGLIMLVFSVLLFLEYFYSFSD